MCCQWGMTVHSQHGVMHCSFLGPSWQMLSKTAGSAAETGAGILAEDGDVRLISERVHVSTARPVEEFVLISVQDVFLIYSQRDARLYLAPVNVVVSFSTTFLIPNTVGLLVFFFFPLSLSLSLSLSLFFPSPRSPQKWPSLQQPLLQDWCRRCSKPSKINTSWMLSWNLADANPSVSVDTGNFYVPLSFDSPDGLWVRREIWSRFFSRNVWGELPPR